MLKKSTLFILLLVGTMAPFLQGCNKYSDGPILSVVSRTERLANIWKVENYKIDGTDYTSIVTNYTEIFSKSGAYSYDWGILGGSGTWAFQNNDMEIKLTGNDNQTSRTLYILKLEEKALWYYYTDNDKRNEFHLSQK
jgi:hypothetical protein